MRAIIIREPGGPEVLELREVPPLDVPHGHVRIRTRFIGVNRADLMQRVGVYPAPPGVPRDIPGLEYSGVIDGVGAGVTSLAEGDRVHGLVAGGAYADQIVAHEREVVRVPDGIDDATAAAAPEAFVTALDALTARAHVRPGENVLVHAAGSGVGTAAIQIVKAMGCFAVGTSRTEAKLEQCRALGLDAAVVAKGGAFAASVRAATGGRGVDVVLDLVGGPYVTETIDACAIGARIVLIGLTGGRNAEVPLALILAKRLTLVGTVLRARPLEEKIEAAKLLERTIDPWLKAGRARAVVDRVFPLEEAGAAHTYVASDASFGKVLLATGN
jgi:putative PIG3 family NAD(P)H quinone oxidoreductase